MPVKTTYQLRPVATADLAQAKGQKSLSNQWPFSDIPRNRNLYKLYYYMLSLSAYDYTARHAFLSDSCWKKKDLAEKLKCHPRTVTNNIKTLIDKKIIYRDEPRRAYIFSEPEISTKIGFEILSSFIDLDDYIDSVCAIKILSVLARARFYRIDRFCVTDIKYAIGKKDLNGDFIRLCLGWWKSLKILDYKETVINKGYCQYIEYELLEFDPSRAITKYNDGILSDEWREKFLEAPSENLR